MKSLSTLLLLFIITACGMPQFAGPVVKNPPVNPSPTPAIPTSPEISPAIPEVEAPAVIPEVVIPSTPQDEIAVYVRTFEARNLLAGGGLNPSTLKITLEDMPINILGTCSMNTATVKLNKFYWNQLAASHKEELVFHELGHCVLGRYHEDARGQDGHPISLMNSFHMGPGVYLRSTAAYRSYMAELFHTTSYTFATVSFNEKNYPATQVYASTLKNSNRSVQSSTLGPDYISCPNH